MKKNIWALIILAAMICSGCAVEEEEPVMDQSVNVETSEAYIGSQETEGTYIGVIENTDSVSVVPLVSGTVEEVNFEVGDTVSAGEVLCQFDDTTAQQNYAAAVTGLKNAKASLASAQANYNNSVATNAQNIIIQHSANDYKTQMDIRAQQNKRDKQGSAVQLASDAVDHAKKAVEDAEKDLKEAEDSGDDDDIERAKRTLRSKEEAYEDAKVRLRTERYSYNGEAIALESAEGQRNWTNGWVYQGQQVVAAAGMDVTQKSVDSAAVGVESANNNIDVAKYQLSLCTVTAPIGGIIEQVNVKKNNYFSSGQISFVISNPNSRRAVFHVADNVASELSVGQKVDIANGARIYEGFISEIGVAVDDTGLFQIKAEVVNAPELADGIYIKLNTIIHRSEDKVTIPTDAVYFEEDQAYVFVNENGIARRRNISIDIYGQEETTVYSGLVAGDKVIDTWSGSLKDGAKVKDTTNDSATSDKDAPSTSGMVLVSVGAS
ncbi:MAG: efflux RND transporter periplasmic adaptor subunit [Lachnospiraceae bacterium]|nr:efflux RND transporter periplasmic adaptor subunit [Lachnospiraceae bacterium]